MNSFLDTQFEKLKTIESVFHYTNLSALMSIVESGELRFTRIDYLNDSKEFKDFTDILETQIQKRYATFEFLYDRSIFDLVVRPLYEKVRESFYKRTFNLSFCINGDSIPMWNYYSESTGICIEFDRAELFKLLSSSNAEFNFRQHPVIYSFDSKQSLIDNYLDRCIEIGNEYENDVETIIGIVQAEFIELSYIGDGFKNEKFEYEEELKFMFHIADHTDINSLVKFHLTKMNIKPYISVNVGKSNWKKVIKSIKISPLNTSELIVDGIYDYLTANEIDIPKGKIKKSKTPLRNL